MRDVALTVVFSGLVLAALTRPWLAILVWCWLDYMNPHRLAYGFAFAFPFIKIAAVVTLFSLVISHDSKRFPITRETIALIAFILWMNLTSLFALNPDGALFEWSRVMKIQLLILLTLMVIHERWHVEALAATIAASLGFYGIKGGIFALAHGGRYMVEGPPATFIEGNNEIALALVTILPLMRYFQLRLNARWARTSAGTATGLTALAVASSYSRAGLLALGIVLLLMWSKTRRKLIMGICVAAAVPLVIHLMPDQWMNRMRSIQDYPHDRSAQGRVNAWGFAMNVANTHPVTGGGFKVFTEELFLTYAPDPHDYHDAHSIYFKVLGEHGYPGLLLFLVLSLLTWRSGTWVRRRAKELPSVQWAADLTGMAQVGLVGYAVGGAFAGLPYFDLPYHLMAIIIVCKQLVRNEISSETSLQPAEQMVTQSPAWLAK